MAYIVNGLQVMQIVESRERKRPIVQKKSGPCRILESLSCSWLHAISATGSDLQLQKLQFCSQTDPVFSAHGSSHSVLVRLCPFDA